MIRSKEGRKKVNEDLHEIKEGADIAISPLATPLMVGPGSIVTAMTFVSGKTWISLIVVILMMALMCFLHFIAFRMSEIIVRRIGDSIIPIVDKMMRLIIAFIGTGMVISGIELAMRQWAQ